MAQVQVSCPYCGTTKVKKGFTCKRKQRYHCRNDGCGRTFILDYKNNGSEPGIQVKIIDMALNASGIRDTAGVLKVSRGKGIVRLTIGC